MTRKAELHLGTMATVGGQGLARVGERGPWQPQGLQSITITLDRVDAISFRVVNGCIISNTLCLYYTLSRPRTFHRDTLYLLAAKEKPELVDPCM